MYDVFDKFLSRETWHTTHALDDQAFYVCLQKVVTAPDFSPDTMGEYFRKKKGQAFEHRIDDLTSKAWGIREYLQTVG